MLLTSIGGVGTRLKFRCFEEMTDFDRLTGLTLKSQLNTGHPTPGLWHVDWCWPKRILL